MERNGDTGSVSTCEEEYEQALLSLIQHRNREVRHIRDCITYYKTQLEEAEKRLHDSQTKLACLRGQANRVSSKSCIQIGTANVKVEQNSSPIHVTQASPFMRHQSKPQLLIPALALKISQLEPPACTSGRASTISGPKDNAAVSPFSCGMLKIKSENSHEIPSDQKPIENKDKGTKRKFGKIPTSGLALQFSDKSYASFQFTTLPHSINYQTSNTISSQHKRRLRSLALCPLNDQLFATSALDGVINLWQVQSKGSGASLLSSTDCLSPKLRRWPEDIAWHPERNSLFSVYSADSGDSQASVMNLNRTQGRSDVTFLEDKPHIKGIVNSIYFMPWDNTVFATGGNDHAIILWKETEMENVWKPKQLHRNWHSSAVMGVAGLQQKQIVLSAGLDKRIIGYDAVAEREDFKHQLDRKCMGVLPNPCDFNLVMVQTGSLERQIRLFDMRRPHAEIHAFGWKQESSESHSALISQSWSPDGLYIASGSVDPVIHIFDIRYNAHKPSQSITAHKRRVFKAMWLHSAPLLISISSDLNIGLLNTA